MPSDIAAGLALLHQEQDKMQQCKDPEDVISHSPSSPIVSLLICNWSSVKRPWNSLRAMIRFGMLLLKQEVREGGCWI